MVGARLLVTEAESPPGIAMSHSVAIFLVVLVILNLIGMTIAAFVIMRRK
jgi:hypothetical protein